MDRGIPTRAASVLGMRQSSCGHCARSSAPTIPSSAHPLLPARNIPRIPHIPRGRTLATASREWGERYPRERPAFVQCQDNHVWSRDRQVIKWRGMPRSGRPLCPYSWGRRPADTIAVAHRRAVIQARSKRPQRVSAVRCPIVHRVPTPILQFVIVLATVLT
jgi:hypothetical protein